MIVRLDLEGCAPAIANVNDARVLARWNNHTVASGRQTLEVNARRFVRAMLGPHHGEDAKLRERWLASQKFCNARELFCGQIVCGDYFGSDRFGIHCDKSRMPR